MASIILHQESGDQKFALESATVTIGRGLESDIRLKDIKASRRHCQIQKTPRGYQLVDLSSGNGTYVNGVQAKQQMLSPGDKIQIGSTTLTFQDGASPQAPAKAPASAAQATEKRAAASAGTAKIERATASHRTAVAATAVTASVQKPAAEKPSAGISTRSQAAAAPARATAKTSAPALTPAPAKKSSTQVTPVRPPSGPFKKGPSGPFKKAGLRTGSTRSAARGPGTSRSAPEGGAKKKSPVLGIALGVLLLGAGAGAYFLFFKKEATAEPHKAKKEASEAHSKKESGREPGSPGGDPRGGRPGGAPDAPAGGDFEAVRTGIAGSCKLGESGHAQWGTAIREWKDYLEKKPVEESRSRAQAQIEELNGKAKVEFGRLEKQVEGMNEEKKKAEALGLLKDNRPRFDGTDSLESIDKLIREFEK
jgi:pSer/pThr/pTyr-binding forkhead associated (FHA) protein